MVNSWNEWDPLREVLVGSATGAYFEPTEPGSQPKVRGVGSAAVAFPTGTKDDERNARAEAELDGLAELMRGRGIRVHRPGPFDFSQSLVTPYFSVENQYCAVCPRDVLLTVGQEVIEATMSRRSRYFEHLAHRPVLNRLWEENDSMTWTAAPKPTMSEQMYEPDFWSWSLEERFERMHTFEFCVTQDEILFDAADVSRLGKDLLVQESMTTNRKGIEWLRRHLGQRGLRVHPVHFPLDLFPSHIDCTFVPLRPGLVLTNPERPIAEDELKFFEVNDWQLVDAPDPVLTNDEMPPYCQSSKWLSMNVLSLSPDTVVVEENEKPLQELLNAHGFEVLTVPFRNVFEYGGSLHCATWDVVRDGGCEDLFPHQ